MKNKVIFTLIALILAIGAFAGFAFRRYQTAKKEVVRLSNNQRSLLSEMDLYRTKDSLSVASIERLQLTNREFERYCSDLKLQVEELGIRVKRLQSVSQTGISTSYPVYIPVRDSIIKTDTLYCVDYRSPYLEISGCADRGVFSGRIVSRDTLTQVVYRIPHKFWFIKWGTKAIRQEVICKNPFANISYTEYIELKK